MIVQRCNSDCGICCIAMALGRTYEEVLEAAGDNYSEMKGLRRESEVLEKLGMSGRFFNGCPSGDYVCMGNGVLDPKFFRSFAFGRRALMTVPSLNFEHTWHMVYWDGAEVHDPSKGKKYNMFVDLKPIELILFREAGKS